MSWPKVRCATKVWPIPLITQDSLGAETIGKFEAAAASTALPPRSMARPPAVMLGREALTTCHHLAFDNADPNANHVVLSLVSYSGIARRPASRPRDCQCCSLVAAPAPISAGQRRSGRATRADCGRPLLHRAVDEGK